MPDVSRGANAFVQMQNIDRFLKTCRNVFKVGKRAGRRGEGGGGGDHVLRCEGGAELMFDDAAGTRA
jgi:hypothetical protein